MMDCIDKHVVLIGFMGSGKTTIGRLLASKLNKRFIDLDQEIERQEKMSISKIFEEKGEIYFRRIENKTLIDVLGVEESAIISSGGGAPCYYDGINIMNSKSVTVYLKIGVAKLVMRLQNDFTRPLVSNRKEKDLAKQIKSKLNERRGVYRQACVKVRAIDSPEQIADRIVKKLLGLKRRTKKKK